MIETTRNAFVLLTAACILFSCTGKNETVRIAVPEGLCRLLADYAVKGRGFAYTGLMGEIFPLTDCCSTTSEWALGAGRVDAAWLCPDAAQALIEKDDRFLVVGPAMVNSEILVTKRGGEIKRIAYSHKREYQKALIEKRFGSRCEAIPVLPAALPYVYERGHVDGVVVDILKGMALKGRHLRLSGDGADVVTYVLVVSKEFRRGRNFPLFLAALRDGAAWLNRTGVLIEALRRQEKVTPDEIAPLSVRFVPPALNETKEIPK